MCHFQKIVVPLSMSEADAGLLRYAALVTELGVTSEVRFVHVITPVRGQASSLTADDVRTKMEIAVNQHFAAASEDVHVECHVVEGTRIDRLVEFSNAHAADLILLGHRKARSGRRSLAQRLAMIASASVWLVPEDSPKRLSRILAPIDFSDYSADGLGMATALARLQGLDSIDALHVFFDPLAIRYDERVDEIRGREQQEFKGFLARVNAHGIQVDPTFMECNVPAEAILRRAEQTKVDLIVMSTRGRSPAAAILLGSATAQIIAESPIPVLAVKHFGAHLNFFEALKASRFWARENAQTN